MATTVVWDFDGTLADSIQLTWKVAELVLEAATGRKVQVASQEDELQMFGSQSLEQIGFRAGDTLRGFPSALRRTRTESSAEYAGLARPQGTDIAMPCLSQGD